VIDQPLYGIHYAIQVSAIIPIVSSFWKEVAGIGQKEAKDMRLRKNVSGFSRRIILTRYDTGKQEPTENEKSNETEKEKLSKVPP
jgi:hypothetical protein